MQIPLQYILHVLHSEACDNHLGAFVYKSVYYVNRGMRQGTFVIYTCEVYMMRTDDTKL